MKLDIRPMKPEERLYAYQQSYQLENQTGSIGCLRADFGRDGTDFYNSWFDHIPSFRGEDFSDEFDRVINALRFESENGGLLKSRNAMRLYCRDYPESAFEGNYGTEYGFRIDYGKYTLLLRCSPMQEEYNLYAYCYVKEFLDRHMEKASRGIRFITPDYKDIFRIPDGDKIQITCSDGEKLLRTCRYIDDCHVEMGRDLYHICEFSERMEQAGNTVIPLRSSLPEWCYSTLPNTGELIIVKHGEQGYYRTNVILHTAEDYRRYADKMNGDLGVSKAQEAAMLAGSMFGWQIPAANPKNYDNKGTLIKPAKNRNRDYER